MFSKTYLWMVIIHMSLLVLASSDTSWARRLTKKGVVRTASNGQLMQESMSLSFVVPSDGKVVIRSTTSDSTDYSIAAGGAEPAGSFVSCSIFGEADPELYWASVLDTATSAYIDMGEVSLNDVTGVAGVWIFQIVGLSPGSTQTVTVTITSTNAICGYAEVLSDACGE